MVYETHQLQGFTTKEERAAQYDDLGLKPFFTYWQDVNNTVGYDILYPKSTLTGDNKQYIGFQKLNTTGGATSNDKGFISSCYAFLNGGQSAVWTAEALAYASDYNTNIFVDKAICGDVVIWRFRQKPKNYDEYIVVFVFDTKAIKVDDGSNVMLVYSGVNNVSQAIKSNFNYYIISVENDTSVISYSASGTNIYMETKNFGKSNKLIIRPYYASGTKSSLYTIDGGQAHPALHQSIVVDDHEFYVLGQGLAVKVS